MSDTWLTNLAILLIEKELADEIDILMMRFQHLLLGKREKFVCKY